MLQKIKRQDCLETCSKFPLREYDKRKDEEALYYPKIHSFYWLKTEAKTTKGLSKRIATEITKLYNDLGIENLTFLCDNNSTWITRSSANRDDYKPLINAVSYLKENKIGVRFNGAIKVEISELREFLQHFYILTMCDASFSYYHFIDEGEKYIGYVHYDGEVRIDTLDNQANTQFLSVIKNTKFIDMHREYSNRI